MLQKIKTRLLIISAFITLLAPLAAPVAVSAVHQKGHNEITEGLCGGSEFVLNPKTGACDRIKTDAGGFNDVLARIINIISVIIGVVAVIMIIFGGFRYITSGGASEKVTAAKNTIMYAIIGLIIVALAQIIVRFVLKETSSAI